MFKFTIRDLLWLTLVVAVSGGCNASRNQTRRVASIVFHNASSNRIAHFRVRSAGGDLDIESDNITVGTEASYHFPVRATRPVVGQSIDVQWESDEPRKATIEIKDRALKNNELHITFGDEGSVTVGEPRPEN